MALARDQAIILRHIDYSETSQVLVVMTREHGKLRFLGKGIKRSTTRRYAPAIDVLERGEVQWSARSSDHGGLLTMTEWSQHTGYLGLRDRLQRLYPAMYAGEATSEMVHDNDPHPHVFDALVELLDNIEHADDGMPGVCLYQRTLLVEVGLFPEMQACVACGRTEFDTRERVYFSSREGGLLCRDCEPAHVEKRHIGPAILAAMRAGELPAADAAEVFELFDYHITNVLAKPLRLAPFVLPSLKRRPGR